MSECKGFWNMCRCAKCRAADAELEAKLDRATPSERAEMVTAAGLDIWLLRDKHSSTAGRLELTACAVAKWWNGDA